MRKHRGKRIVPSKYRIKYLDSAEREYIGLTNEYMAIEREVLMKFAETIPLTIISGMSEEYCTSQVFVCTEFYGTPIAFNTEMENARFEPVSDVLKHELFLPFELSVRELLN